MVPDTFQDFISTPKNNGYQSLHTVIVDHYFKKVEIQIRTYKMHDIAELGVAAHYAINKGRMSVDTTQYVWIRGIAFNSGTK